MFPLSQYVGEYPRDLNRRSRGVRRVTAAYRVPEHVTHGLAHAARDVSAARGFATTDFAADHDDDVCGIRDDPSPIATSRKY